MMDSSREGLSAADDLVIELLRTQYLQLDKRRVELNQQISTSGHTSTQEALWQELDGIVGRLTAIGSELATVSVAGAAGLVAKAQVLAGLSQSQGDDPSSLWALALSLAADVIRLM
jgi:hypothetical protein